MRLSGIEMGLCDRSDLVEEFLDCDSAQKGAVELVDVEQNDFDVSIYIANPDSVMDEAQKTKLRGDTTEGGSDNVVSLALGEVSRDECGASEVCLHDRHVESEELYSDKKSLLDVYTMPSNISPSTDPWSNYFETTEQKGTKFEDGDSRSPIKYVEDDNDSASFDEFWRKTMLKDLEEKEYINICSRVLPSQSSEIYVDVLHHTSDFPLNYVERAEQDDRISIGASSTKRVSEVVPEKSKIDSVNGGYASRAMEMSEGKEDVQNVEMAETYINESLVKDNSGKFNEGLSNAAGNSTTPRAIPSYGIARNVPFNRLGVSNYFVTGNDVTQSNSTITGNSLEDMDNEERDKILFDSLLKSETPNYMCLSSQRSKNKSKSSREKKPSNRVLDSDKTTEILSEASRRKRSCISKPARSSAWGFLANISAIFEQNNRLDSHNHFIKNSQKAQKAKGRRRNKGDGSRDGGGSPKSKKKHQAGSHIRLKIKIGKQMDHSIMKVMASGRDGEEIPATVDSRTDASYLEGNVADKYLESCIPLCESFINNSEDVPEISTLVEAKLEAPVEGIENKYLDPGTSPDSEVINQIPDVCASLRAQEDRHNVHLNSPNDYVVPRDVPELSVPKMCSIKGTTNGKIYGASECVVNLKCGLEDDFFPIPNLGFESFESENVENTLLPSKKKGNKSSKKLKSSRVSKSKSEMPDAGGSKRGFFGRQKETRGKSLDKSKVMEKCVSDEFLYKEESLPEIGTHVVYDIEGKNMGDEDALEDKSNLVMIPNGVLEPYLPPRNAWVSCDECQKWRRIPATLADSIDETNSIWACKDNIDKAFADCSTPQEMSNAEINAELDISDEENANGDRYNSKGFERRHSTVAQPSAWTLIKSNLFLHRKRKSQNIDETMVCNCKSSAHGHSGCGDDCLNRMLNIECVKGTCPCGDRCSNQQFQKHSYAKLNSFRCGKKGYGLQILEDISKGQFLIEYVGEVLDLHAYEARQRDYASRGHKHFYFMTLNGSEVIDACAKGNLGRFINHSCDPNCRTEKWLVNGEICIGLFAIRNIKKGEELTFDYNYVRVFGAAAKKCVCGSSHCRGYIGGDPLSDEVIIQGDSDEEFPEPVMVADDGETSPRLDNILPKFSAYNIEKIQTEDAVKGRNSIEEYASPVVQVITENEESTQICARDVPQSSICSKMEVSIGKLPSSAELVELPTKDMIRNPILTAQRDITTIQEPVNKSPSYVLKLEESISHTYDANKNPPLVKVEDYQISLKSQLPLKSSHTSSSVKRRKHKSKTASTNKSKVIPFKPKKVLQGSANSRYEAIEEKLNELLDADGGISKRNDASKGYLKLLLLTAASGDSGTGEAIQSNRDLSMILDALLKTRSRIVLVDIINKNGLRMLHNIMKQSRKEYNKTPILRKLLKVLEYLAAKQILTLEHINGGPPCPGMESFRDSIQRLTEHSNKQVYQIARNFRDRWMPRSSRNNNCMERDDGRADFRKGSNCNRFSTSNNYGQDHQAVRATEATIDCTKQDECSSSSGAHCSTNGLKTRKRKSRWDEPDETNLSLKEQKIQPSPLHNPDSISQIQMPELVQNHTDRVNEDVPPGFSCPINVDIPGESVGHSKCSFEKMALGNPQERYISSLPVSYGIPLSMLQQIGISEAESVESWKNAPGIIFQPFPPLPQYPPNRKNISPCVSATHNMDQSSPSTSGVALTDINVPRTNNHHTFHQARGYPNDLGKRFKQQKWNNRILTPPWLRKRNDGWRQNGNYPFSQQPRRENQN